MFLPSVKSLHMGISGCPRLLGFLSDRTEHIPVMREHLTQKCPALCHEPLQQPSKSIEQDSPCENDASIACAMPSSTATSAAHSIFWSLPCQRLS